MATRGLRIGYPNPGDYTFSAERGLYVLSGQDATLSTTAESVAVDGEEFSFTSSVSDSNSATYSFLGGKDGYLDSGTHNTDCTPLPADWYGPSDAVPPGEWQFPGSGGTPADNFDSNYYPRFDNMSAHSTSPLCRANSLGFSGAYHDAENPGNGTSFGIGYDVAGVGGAITEVYNSGYVYYGCNVGVSSLQWKIYKLKFMPTIQDNNPQVSYSHWIDDDQWTFTHAAGSFGTGVYFEGTAPFDDGMPHFHTDDRQWYRWELWHKPATSATALDGEVTLKVWRVSDGTQVVNFSDTGIDDYDDTSRYRFFNMQNYFGNAVPDEGTAENPTSGGGFAFWDDVVVQGGTGSRRGIWLGDASTYAACNKGMLAWQPWSTWSGTSRVITLNKGPHASLTGKYLYEQAADGSIVNSDGIPL